MKTNYSIYKTFVVISLLISCKSELQKNNSIEGVWESIGYGRIFQIDSTTYSIYDITKMSCLPIGVGSSSDFDGVISFKSDTLSIKRGYSVYSYTRIEDLPELCKDNIQVNNDPIYNYEVFANTFAEQYAFFELNVINWDSLYTSNKKKITEQTTEAELYLIMDKMITTLNDNHGSIEPTDDVYEQTELMTASSDSNPVLKEYGDFGIAQLVSDNFIDEDLTNDSWLLNWGKMKNNVGYIQIKAMMLYAELGLSEELVAENGYVQTYFDAFDSLSGKDQIEMEVNGIRKIMNSVMLDLKDTKHIILDIRFNGGGNDEVSLEILRHFNPTKKLIAYKKGRHGADFTKTIPIYLDAFSKPYTKPVYVLSSQQSASAADMFLLSTLELKHFTRIGSHSNGAISDALQKRLPNGWYFSLSNEIYSDLKGNIYENTGIPVDYELNYPADRQTFFRSIADNLEGDKTLILQAIEDLNNE
jgi:C-terminal processing protease CtpA/Prc